MLSKNWISIWESIFLVNLTLQMLSLCLFDCFKDKWLSVFTLVYTDTQKYLLRVLIGKEAVDESEYWIWWGCLLVFPNSWWKCVH